MLEEAGLADEGVIQRMVADLQDASTDRLLAQGATPRENRDRMFRHLLRVCSSIIVDFVHKFVFLKLFFVL